MNLFCRMLDKVEDARCIRFIDSNAGGRLVTVNQENRARDLRSGEGVLLVAISVGCLILFSVSFLSFISWEWATFADVPWYAGPPEWIAISALILLLFLQERLGGSHQDFGFAFSTVFLAWVVSNIVLGVFGLYVLFSNVSVPVRFAEAILFGTVTLGLAQLGIAGVLRAHLCRRTLGFLAWSLAVGYGAIVVVASIVLSAHFLS